jgi:hypothetical protein
MSHGHFLKYIDYTYIRYDSVEDQLYANLNLHTEQRKQNKLTQTSMMLRVEFEHQLSVFERTKRNHALSRSATENSNDTTLTN